MATTPISFGWTGYSDQVADPELAAFIRAVNVSLRGLWQDTQAQMLYRTSLPSTWSAISGFTVGSRRFLLQDGVAADSPTWGIVTFPDISGSITYAQLPTGNGSWDTGVGTTATITRSFTISGTLTTAAINASGLITITPTGNSAISANQATNNTAILVTQPAGTAASGLVIFSGSVTGASAPQIIQLAQTWNTSGAPVGYFLNITNTASGAGSRLIDLKVASGSKFSVDVSGNTSLATGAAYQINAVSVLNATTLGVNVVTSSLTGVGALIAGSIVSGFGSINIGSNVFTGGRADLNGVAGIAMNVGADVRFTNLWDVGTSGARAGNFWIQNLNASGTIGGTTITASTKVTVVDVDVTKAGTGIIGLPKLGLGNIVAATVGVGLLADKIEVFDLSGTSMGFVPIYATIT